MLLLPVLLPAATAAGAALPALAPAAGGLRACGSTSRAEGVVRGRVPAVLLTGVADLTEAAVPVAGCLASVLGSTGSCTLLVSVARDAACLAGVTGGWLSGKVGADCGACALLLSAPVLQVAALPTRKGLKELGVAAVPAAGNRVPHAPTGGPPG